METMPKRYRNPVIPGFHPDPSICRVGSDFYLVTSSFHYFPGVPVFHSRDLVHWRQIGHVLSRESQLDLDGCPSSLGIFAPTIRYHAGRFYVITTNMKLQRNFYVWSEHPEGPWSDPVWIDWPGIDPSLFFDDDGRVYITGNGGFLGDEPVGIYQAEIDIGSGRLLSERRLVWTGTGGKAPEGPHLYKYNGYYYLVIAEGGTEYGHMACVARSRHPFGPFEGCPYNPVLTHRSTASPIQATGHADLVQLEDGSWWAVFHGVRPAPVPFGGLHHHLGRETFLAPVTWTEDGWPVIGRNGMVSEWMDADGLSLENEAPWEELDDFDGDRLRLCWNFLRNPRPEDWSLAEKPGWLTLHGSAASLDDVASPAFVGRRQQHFACEVAARLSFSPVCDGEEAGLTVFMSEKFHYEIALAYRDGSRRLMFRRRIGSLWKVDREESFGDTDLILGVRTDPSRYAFFCERLDGVRISFGEGECALLSTEVAGGFTGVYFGLYATGNGKRCTVPARFDWFRYHPG